MANRRMSQFTFCNLNMPVQLFMKVTFGSTGAPTLANNNNGFVTSVTRTAAGTYTILLADKYNTLVGVDHVFIVSAAAPASPEMRVKTDSIASAGSIAVVFSIGGVATDPASGEIVLMTINLKNSSV